MNQNKSVRWAKDQASQSPVIMSVIMHGRREGHSKNAGTYIFFYLGKLEISKLEYIYIFNLAKLAELAKLVEIKLSVNSSIFFLFLLYFHILYILINLKFKT